ncbi:MAG: hypothetical protein VKI83_09925 [Synechococcaceae cyanobacterium]|nr:hypothetical protein [Synechococcaceae cyanobacterium]
MEPPQSRDALISLLGFPSWGPLHLRLRQDGTPSDLAHRLQPGLGERAGKLPTLLLHSCPSAEPLLLRCSRWPSGCSLRYRLLWHPGDGADARITLWRRAAGEGRWHCAWRTSRLEGFASHWRVSSWDARGLGLTPSSDWRP